MDFGVAKALAQDHSLSVSGLVMGTPAYMPPEQAEGRISDIDGRSDVYSLGATMYSVLLGRPPHEGQSAMEILRKVSAEPPKRPREIDPSFPAELGFREHVEWCCGVYEALQRDAFLIGADRAR